MRISVLGCGRIGEMHAKNIAQHDQAQLGLVKENELTRCFGTASETAPPYQTFFSERYQASFHAEISAFVRAFETNGAPEASFDDGPMALVLAEAAMLSMRDGRVVTPQEIK